MTMPENRQKRAEGDDPFGSLSDAQMFVALRVVAAMARQEVRSINRFPLAIDDFLAGLDCLRRQVIANQQACEWSDYRKTLIATPADLAQVHKAFIAGWEAGQGKSFEEGALR